MIRRGTVYQLAGGSENLFGVLVLTNDTWNRRMKTVGVVPVRAPREADSVWTPRFREYPLQAFIGFLASFPASRLLESRHVLDDMELSRATQGLADLFHLDSLLDNPPVAPPAVAGTGHFPRWSEIYYAGPPVGPNRQTKRYVVVSDERWNALGRGAIAVRTTSQQKTWGDAFPIIESGAARACCGDATVFPPTMFNLRDRPRPSSLSLDDMVVIARGLCDVLDLDIA